MGIRVAFVTGPEESIGVKYLSAVLKENGHETDLFFDPQLFNDEVISIKALSRIFDLRENLVGDILNYNPDLVAFSVHSDFFNWASDLACRLKKKTNIPIIFGGIHPSSVPEEVIKSTIIDMVCVGEGEYPLLELANSIDTGKKRVDIQNIWFKNNGQIIRNPLRPLVNVDNLPCPDHDLYYRKNAYFRIGYHTIASRGCPYRCSYCCHSKLKSLYGEEKYYRVRRVDNLIREIGKNLQRCNFKVVRFYDDIFPFDMEWLGRFSELYRQHINLPFICYLHPILVNEDRIAILKKAGCSEIRLGVQSLNPEIRNKILNRNESNETIKRAIDVIKEFKVKLVTENIIGLPGQSYNDFNLMLQFYNKNRPTRNHFFWLRYYPGLEIEKYRDYSKRKKDSGLKEYSKIFTQGGDTYQQINPNLVLALYSVSWLPGWAIRLFFKKRILRHLPLFTLQILNIFSNLMSRSYSDQIGRDRTFKRYSFYLINFFAIKINNSLQYKIS